MAAARDRVNGVFYVPRSGLPWRMLPTNAPSASAVQRYFHACRDVGLWTIIEPQRVETEWQGQRMDRKIGSLHRAIGFPVAAAFTFCPSATFASTSQSGAISNIVSVRQGRLFFNHSGARGAPPACAIAPGRWVIDLSAPGGQIIAAQVLSAYSLGKSVIVQGTGACEDWPDTESVNYLQIVN